MKNIPLLCNCQGVLRIQVVQAIKLMKKDVGVLGKGKSDPYVIVGMGAQEFRSQTINNTVNPKWDFWCEVSFTSNFYQLGVIIHNVSTKTLLNSLSLTE